jgi:hypothetical protein
MLRLLEGIHLGISIQGSQEIISPVFRYLIFSKERHRALALKF